ncbi:FUSC family protein [Roseibium sp. RKSG952]|uniref:FUSC family protein n=1 Tax=Roseibium sp. RKSG952 TaxID=2529384 RepID=UPI0012BD09E6|nr:FUSC family protein [Roseibium sp. RKSG952]MTH97038.1 hypothetical protein [Roseibium sp. RKSG952]
MSQVRNWQPKAIAMASACVSAAVLGETLHLPSSYLAPIFAFVFVSFESKGFGLKLTSSLIGIFLGAFFGSIASDLLINSPAGQFLFIVVVSYLSVLARFAPIKTAFAWRMCFRLQVAAVITSLASPTDLYATYLDTSFSILIGVLCAGAVSLIGMGLGFAEPVVTGPQEAPETGQDALRDAELVALVSAAAIAIALVLWIWFDIPAINQVVITIIMTVDRDIASGRARRQQRLVGCLVGGLIALAVIAMNPQNYLVWSTIFFVVIYLGSAWQINEVDRAYAGLQAAVAFIMVLGISKINDGDIITGVERLAGIFIGIALMIWLRHPFRLVLFKLYSIMAGAKSSSE